MNKSLVGAFAVVVVAVSAVFAVDVNGQGLRGVVPSRDLPTREVPPPEHRHSDGHSDGKIVLLDPIPFYVNQSDISKRRLLQLGEMLGMSSAVSEEDKILVMHFGNDHFGHLEHHGSAGDEHSVEFRMHIIKLGKNVVATDITLMKRNEEQHLADLVKKLIENSKRKRLPVKFAVDLDANRIHIDFIR